MKNTRNGVFANLKNDFPAGIVVFLVAVPLCLGIALASGAPLFSGIISGMVGGIIVSAFSKSPLGVSGPAAGLAAIVLTAIPDLGGFEVFLLAVFFAGVIQFTLGVLKAGIIGYYFPSSVIKGMLAGIGVIIFLKQIPHAFGYDADPEGDFSFIQSDGQNTFSELGNMLDFISPGALIITVVSLAILVLWEQKFIKKLPVSQWVQGPLVAVVVGILLNQLFNNSENIGLSQDHLVSLPLDGTLAGFFGEFRFPDFSQWNNPQVYTIAFTLAIVASLETLLCVEATDKLDPQKRITPTNQELRAQGIGNMVSGLIGGLPVTQVIVRSSANIQSGGKTRMSAFIHGLLILVCVLTIPNVLNMIPLASLAAILLVVGFKLAKPALFRSMYALGWMEFIPFVVTIGGIVFTDLLTGIGLGMAMAVFFILYKNYQKPYIFDAEKYKDGETVHLTLAESVTFLNKGSMSKSLALIPDGQSVILDATKTTDMHPDVLEIIHDFEENAKTRNIEVELIGFDEMESETQTKVFEKLVGLPNQNRK
jgi:MFS superfamily sulfate permease-like transporter